MAYLGPSPLAVGFGGTGASSLTGVLTGNVAAAFTASTVTQNAVLVGGVANAITSVAIGTQGQPLLSGGVGVDPSFGTLGVSGGGTGATTLTGIVLGNGTSPFTTATFVASTSFTPVLNFGGATTGITYTTQLGHYQQFGSLIMFSIFLLLSSKGSATGNATITGLPTASANDGTISSWVFTGLTVSADASNTYYYASLPSNSTTLTLNESIITTGATAILQDTNFAATSSLRISGGYFV